MHRAEHWIVVKGTASAMIDGVARTLGEGESLHVPMATAHRLSNPGAIDCVMIEVQTGDYVGEDDIVRLEDNYGRK